MKSVRSKLGVVALVVVMLFGSLAPAAEVTAHPIGGIVDDLLKRLPALCRIICDDVGKRLDEVLLVVFDDGKRAVSAKVESVLASQEKPLADQIVHSTLCQTLEIPIEENRWPTQHDVDNILQSVVTDVVLNFAELTFSQLKLIGVAEDIDGLIDAVASSSDYQEARLGVEIEKYC